MTQLPQHFSCRGSEFQYPALLTGRTAGTEKICPEILNTVGVEEL